MEILLINIIKNDLDIIEFKKGYIKIQNNHQVNYENLKSKLYKATGSHWIIEIDYSQKGIKYQEIEKKNIEKRKFDILHQELTQKVLKSFSGLEIDDIRLTNDN